MINTDPYIMELIKYVLANPITFGIVGGILKIIAVKTGHEKILIMLKKWFIGVSSRKM